MTQELYTVMVPQEVLSNTTRGEVRRNIITTYFDVPWSQVGFYGRKHGATHISVELQTRRIGKSPDVRVLDDIQWSAAAIEGTRRYEEARAKLGGVATRPVTRPVSFVRSEPPALRPGERVKVDMDYADLVNTMVKEA